MTVSGTHASGGGWLSGEVGSGGRGVGWLLQVRP